MFPFLQGLMFGYATDETEECMPLTVVLAHKLNQKIAELRRSGELWWARPDTKTQVKLLTLVATPYDFNELISRVGRNRTFQLHNLE